MSCIEKLNWKTFCKQCFKIVLNFFFTFADQIVSSLVIRLVTVEERLRREQSELQVTLDQKQAIIEAQERRLMALDAANTRLLVALNQLKERHVVQMHQNGVGSPSTTKLSLATENGQFKSSSC